jgi:hypothetical protein
MESQNHSLTKRGHEILHVGALGCLLLILTYSNSLLARLIISRMWACWSLSWPYLAQSFLAISRIKGSDLHACPMTSPLFFVLTHILDLTPTRPFCDHIIFYCKRAPFPSPIPPRELLALCRTSQSHSISTTAHARDRNRLHINNRLIGGSHNRLIDC